MMELRLGFVMHGYDVNPYTDDEVNGAIVAEAMADTQSSRDLFSRAFERLKQGAARCLPKAHEKTLD